MVQPESVAFLGAALWFLAALVTGLPEGRVPPVFPMLFADMAVIGSLVGLSESVPQNVDVAFTLAAVLLFAVTPIVLTAFLLHRYPADPPPQKPREVGD